jgi:hypothetical protein
MKVVKLIKGTNGGQLAVDRSRRTLLRRMHKAPDLSGPLPGSELEPVRESANILQLDVLPANAGLLEEREEIPQVESIGPNGPG